MTEEKTKTDSKNVAATPKAKSESSVKASSETISTNKKDAKEQQQAPKKQKNTNWALRILLILLVFLGGMVAAVYFMPTLKERIPIIANWVGNAQDNDIDISAINQKIANQQSTINDLVRKTDNFDDRLNQLSEEPLTINTQDAGNGQNIPIIDNELIARIEAMEERLAIVPEENTEETETDNSQSARIDMLLNRMAQLEASFIPLSKNMVDTQTAERERRILEQDNQALTSKVTDLESRLMAVETIAAKDNRGVLLNLKIAELRRKAIAGLPYKEELQSVSTMIEDTALKTNERFSSAIRQLSENANTGVLTPDQLTKKFNDLIPEMLNLANQQDSGSWWQSTLNQIKNLISVRRTDGASYNDMGLDGLITDIERWLGSADIQSAMQVLEALPEAIQSLMEAWKIEAEKWLNNKDALEDLESVAAEDYLSVNAPVMNNENNNSGINL